MDNKQHNKETFDAIQVFVDEIKDISRGYIAECAMSGRHYKDGNTLVKNFYKDTGTILENRLLELAKDNPEMACASLEASSVYMAVVEDALNNLVDAMPTLFPELKSRCYHK